MKRVSLIVILLAVCVMPTVEADWTASKNGHFFQRATYIAERMQVLRNECASMLEWWAAESVSSDPAFLAVDGITTAEVTDLMTYCQSLYSFHENEAVATSNRKATLAPFLANGQP